MRKNPFVRVGRPPKLGAPSGLGKVGLGGPAGMKGPMVGASPMQGFSPSVPAASFRRGGGVNGHKTMPSYHEDPNFKKGGSY